MQKLRYVQGRLVDEQMSVAIDGTVHIDGHILDPRDAVYAMERSGAFMATSGESEIGRAHV